MNRYGKIPTYDQFYTATTKHVTECIYGLKTWMPDSTHECKYISDSTNNIRTLCARSSEVILPQDVSTIVQFYERFLSVITNKTIPEESIFAIDDIIAKCKRCAAHYRRPGITGFLAITLQSLRFLLFNRWRFQRGSERRRNAILIVRCFAPAVRNFITSGTLDSEFISFVETQFQLCVDDNPTRHVVYALTGRSTLYIGQSSSNNGPIQAPLRRWIQHYLDLQSHPKKTYKHTSEHKINQFQSEQPRDICIITVSTHECLEHARAHETFLIKTCRPNANVHHCPRTRTARPFDKTNAITVRPSYDRRRPPPHLRTRPTDNAYATAITQHAVHRTQTNTEQKNTTSQTQIIATAPFKTAYTEFSKMQQPYLGPHCIRSLPQLGLSYIACAKPKEATEWVTTVPQVLKLSELCEKLKPSAKCNTIRRRLAWKHRQLNLPPNRTICVPIFPTCRPMIKLALKLLYEMMKSTRNLSFKWWKDHLQFYKQPWPKVEQRLSKASAITDATIGPLHHKPAEWKQNAIDGRDMVRVKINLGLPDLDLYPMFPMSQLSAIDRALAQGRFPNRSSCIKRLRDNKTVMSSQLPMPHLSDEIIKEFHRIPSIPLGFILVGEDKDKHSAWIVDHESHLWRIYQQFYTSPLRWQFMTMPINDVLRQRRTLHQLSPYTRKTCHTPKLMDHTTLPAIYCTIKSKCYDTGTHTCKKPNHSCMRSIVSWYNYPYRTRARSLRFAFNAVLHATTYTTATCKHRLSGWETPSLQTALQDLQRAHAQLVHMVEYKHTCIKCQKPKSAISTVVCDAGQMFEQVSPINALESFNESTRYLEHQGYIGVRIDNRNPLTYTFVRQRFPRDNVFEFVELRSWIALLSNQPCAILSEHVVTQTSGLPIGGLISKAGTSFYLGSKERISKQMFSSQQRYPGKQTALIATEVFAGVRYVDDTILSSAIECEDCLYEYCCELYHPIQFDRQPQKNAPYHTWLDIELQHDDYMTSFRYARREQDWLSGANHAPSKFRSPPYVAKFDQNTWTCTRGMLIGRETRIRELKLPVLEENRARCEELLLWLRGGWPIAGLRRLLTSHSRLRDMHALFSTYIAKLPRNDDTTCLWYFQDPATEMIKNVPYEHPQV